MFVSLSELMNKDIEVVKQYVRKKASMKFEDLKSKTYVLNKKVPDMDCFLELPKSWFVKQVYKGEDTEENWEAQISINTTRSF